MRLTLTLLLLGWLSSAQAVEYTVVRAQDSQIDFMTHQMGVPATGRFTRFKTSLTFNPERPQRSAAQVEIDLAGIDTGSSEVDQEVMGRDWFDVAHYPTARFSLDRLSAPKTGQAIAQGKLTLKGKTVELKIPLTLTQRDNMLTLSGKFSLKRLDFGIGSGIWSDTDTVADEVEVSFRFIVSPQ